MRLKIALLVLIIALGVAPSRISGQEQSSASPPTASPSPTPKPTKEEAKKAKEEAKAKEKADKLAEKDQKQADKDRRNQEKRERAAHLASAPMVTVSGVKAETLGQVLTAQLASDGFSLTEYQPPQNVFGMSTSYKAVYSKPATDFNTLVNTGVWIYLTYGVPSAGQGAITYFMVFEIADTPQGAVVTGRYGLTAPTVKGVAIRDMTSVEGWRSFLDNVLNNAKRYAEFTRN
jgi:hypothetical protein